MLTAIVGSTVFAGTVEREVYGYNVKKINDSYTGSVGVYSAVVNQDVAGLEVRNVGGSSRYYRLECSVYSNARREFIDFEASTTILSPGGIATEAIGRDYRDTMLSYGILGEGYYGTHTTSGLADRYYFYVEQYDD